MRIDDDDADDNDVNFHSTSICSSLRFRAPPSQVKNSFQRRLVINVGCTLALMHHVYILLVQATSLQLSFLLGSFTSAYMLEAKPYLTK